MTKRAFGELESQILYILREGKRLTVKEVHRLLGGGDNYNTVMTVMSRLAVKGTLNREKMGLQYEYWIAKQLTLFEKIKNKFFGVKTGELVCHLIANADDLTDQELEEMESILKRVKEARK